VTPFLHTRVDWAARDAYARPIPTTLPIRPVTTPVSSAGQAVMTVGVAAGLVLIAVAAVRLGRRWSTAVPALVVLGTLFAGFYEPMENMAAHMWYYRPGQVAFFDAFDRSLPVWVFFSYAAFYGGFGLLAWWLAERGSPRSHLVRFVLGLWVFAIVTEIVGTQLNTYEYFGRAPFRVAGFPLWVSLSNAAICTTFGVAAARLRRLLTGREQLALLCLGPFAITLGLVGTGFPELVALNTDEAATDPRYVAARARIELVSTTRDPTCGDSTPRASRCT